MIAAAVTAALLAAAEPRVIGFDEAVRQALETSPAMRVAATDRARALALVEQARAPSLPSLALNGAYTRLDADRIVNGNVAAAANQLTANAQLAVPLVAPARWAQWSRAGLNADAAEATAADVTRQVALNAARTWLSTLGQHQVVEASERSVKVAEAHLATARDRRAGGVGNKLEEYRAAQELSVAQTQRLAALGALVRLQEALGVAVGVDQPLDTRREEPALGAGQAEAQALEGAATRLDVQAAEARKASAEKATGWDFADYLPLLSATAQGGMQNPPTLTVPLWNFQAQLVLSIPLYDGGLRYGQQKERRAARDAAAAAAEGVLRQARSEVRGAFAQVTLADQALTASRDAAREAGDALAAAQDAFRAGAITNLDVVDAERRARDAETQVALAENAARQARLDVLAASGQFPVSPAPAAR
ncbi:MAG: TolC family protein [Myxococcaceae bacterium]|nr:TolC family protein [Myxococcaceae bacterium]